MLLCKKFLITDMETVEPIWFLSTDTSRADTSSVFFLLFEDLISPSSEFHSDGLANLMLQVKSDWIQPLGVTFGRLNWLSHSSPSPHVK